MNLFANLKKMFNVLDVDIKQRQLQVEEQERLHVQRLNERLATIMIDMGSIERNCSGFWAAHKEELERYRKLEREANVIHSYLKIRNTVK